MSDELVRPWASDPDRAPRIAAPGHLVGRASDLQLRYEGGGEGARRTVLSFRLATVRGLREVEVRGYQLSGGVREGDWVDVADQSGHGLIRTGSLENLTTGITVSTGPTSVAFRAVFVVALVAILIGFVIVAVLVGRGFLESGGFSGP